MTPKDKVLVYHSVGERAVDEIGAGLYCVPVEEFRRQMAYVAKSNVHSPQSTVHKEIAVTFDDGDETNYTQAYPILKELGLKAYFFILTSRVGSSGYMSWEQIKTLKDAGMIIGSHGVTHRILTSLKEGEVEHELKESKRIVEEMLGIKVTYLSVPRGFYDMKVINKAKEIGYEAVFTSDVVSSDPYKYSRIGVKADWRLEQFVNVLENGYPLRYRICQAIIDSAKRIFGHTGYDNIRTLLLRSSHEKD